MKEKKGWKRALAATMAAVMLLVMAACSGPEETGEADQNLTYEIALVSSAATIEDNSFNASIWRGIERFVGEKPTSYKSYLTSGDSKEACLKVIDEAVEGGAEFVIAAGSAFSNAVSQAQKIYQDVHFVLVDGRPMAEGSYRTDITENTASILFDETQVGYLAGYAAIKEGYVNLGFIGGKAQAPVKRFGYGFVQGAKQAATEENLTGIHIRYDYADTYNMDTKVFELAESWYRGGTEVIFACNGAGGKSVMKAAENLSGQVIGVDTDQAGESDTVVFSAVKNLEDAVYHILINDEKNAFPGGEIVLFNAENKGIGLSMESSKLRNFGIPEYDAALKKLVQGEFAINMRNISSVEELTDARVKVEESKALHVRTEKE